MKRYLLSYVTTESPISNAKDYTEIVGENKILKQDFTAMISTAFDNDGRLNKWTTNIWTNLRLSYNRFLLPTPSLQLDLIWDKQVKTSPATHFLFEPLIIIAPWLVNQRGISISSQNIRTIPFGLPFISKRNKQFTHLSSFSTLASSSV